MGKEIKNTEQPMKHREKDKDGRREEFGSNPSFSNFNGNDRINEKGKGNEIENNESIGSIFEDQRKKQKNQRDETNGKNADSAEQRKKQSTGEKRNKDKEDSQSPFMESNGKGDKKKNKGWDSIFNLFGSEQDVQENKGSTKEPIKEKSSFSDRNEIGEEMMRVKDENRGNM